MLHLSIHWVVLNRGYLHSFGVNCHLEGCHWKVIIVIHSHVLHGACIVFQLTTAKQPSWYMLQRCIWFMQWPRSVWRFPKNKLVKMSRAPEPRTISLLQAAVEWECGTGAELNGGLCCGTAEVWSAEHTRTLRGPLQAQRHHPDTHQARNTLRGCRLLASSMGLFILSGAYGRGDSQGGFGKRGKRSKWLRNQI